MGRLGEAKKQLYLAGRVIHLVWESSPWWTLSYFSFLTLRNIILALGVYLIKIVVDAIVAANQTRSAETFQHFLVVLGIMAGLRLSVPLLGAFQRHSQNVLKDVLGLYMVETVAAKIASMDFAFFEDPKFHDKIEIVRREALSRPYECLMNVALTLAATISIVTLTVSMVTIAWWVPVVIFLASLPRIIFSFKFSYRTYSIISNQSPYQREVKVLTRFLVEPGHAAEVKIFELKDYLLGKFKTIYQKFIDENIALSKTSGIYIFFLSTLTTVVNILTLAYLGFLAVMGQISIGSFSFFISAANNLSNNYAELYDEIADFYKSSLFLQNYFEFLDIKPKIVDQPNAKSLNLTKPLAIEFKNVSFGYTPDKLVLKNINFKIDNARNLALIGENGAGKTTLIKLLLRLYDVQKGEILLNGINIRDIKLTSLHEALSVIFQNFNNYEMDVRENIGIGDLKKINNIGAIRKAARLSGAAEFIEEFPNKYRTKLGKTFEGGEEISGGQWQKIAIARAFFKDANAIIMDEPTSALDPKSEYEVFKNLIEHTKDKSLILISHRFSTVRLADEIIVLHKGEIVEKGTHEELTRKNGQYAKLYGLQAKWYK